MKSNDSKDRNAAAQNAAPAVSTASDAAALVADIAARKARLQRALTETQQQRKSNQIVNDAQAALEKIDSGVSAAPEPGPAGSVRARVIGIFRTNTSQRAPLPGVTVRLTVKEKSADQQKTDALGAVELNFPEAKLVDAKLEVLDASGSVLAAENIVAAKEQAPVRLFELPSNRALAAPFDHARQWLDARAAAAANLAGLSSQVQKALASQEAELQSLIVAADAELNQVQAQPAPAPQPEPASQPNPAPVPSKPPSGSPSKSPLKRKDKPKS
jgi:hypothetical protein